MRYSKSDSFTALLQRTQEHRVDATEDFFGSINLLAVRMLNKLSERQLDDLLELKSEEETFEAINALVHSLRMVPDYRGQKGDRERDCLIELLVKAFCKSRNPYYGPLDKYCDQTVEDIQNTKNQYQAKRSETAKRKAICVARILHEENKIGIVDRNGERKLDFFEVHANSTRAAQRFFERNPAFQETHLLKIIGCCIDLKHRAPNDILSKYPLAATAEGLSYVLMNITRLIAELGLEDFPKCTPLAYNELFPKKSQD